MLCDPGSSNRVLYDNLEGWDGVGHGREIQEGGAYVYLWLIHVDIWQKPTQYYQGITRQLKINKITFKFLKKKQKERKGEIPSL